MPLDAVEGEAMKYRLTTGRDGITRCNTHATSGAPAYFYPGCKLCEEARAKGIIRPDASLTSPKKRAKGIRKRGITVEWDKVKPENLADCAAAISAARCGF